MKWVGWTLGKLWRIIFFINAFITFLPFYPLFLLTVYHPPFFRIAFALKRVWAFFMIYPMGIWLKKEFEEKLPKGTYVFVPNHTSYLDIIISYLIIPQYFIYVGKVELLNWKFFRIFFQKMNIPVDRENLKRTYNSWARAEDLLKEGTSIGIYPEGRIPFDVPNIGPFKNGPFKLALGAQVPLVPITFVHNWKLLPAWPTMWSEGGRPGFSYVKIHKPIPTAGMTEANLGTLRKQVRDIMDQELQRHGYHQEPK